MIKKIRSILFKIICSFCVPSIYNKYYKQLQAMPEDVQLFLMTRMDLGTHIFLLHYTKCWEEKRGKTCVAVLTGHFDLAGRLAKILSPKTKIISSDHKFMHALVKVFGARRVHYHIFNRVYSRLATNFPNALYLYDETRSGCSNFIPFFDKHLQNASLEIPEPFIQAYKKARKVFDYRYDVLLDLFHLHHESFGTKPTILQEKLEFLKKSLKIDRPYVILNLNCKDYKNTAANRRPIVEPQRYNCVIDRLIELNFNVVLQGREEQPLFKKRKGLIDYARSCHISLENDLGLFSGASFAILPKTGPELFALVCDLPVLGLNYTEWSALIPNVKSRFFPKHIKDKTGRYVHWEEMLKSPSFFDMGQHDFGEKITYEELDEEELLASLHEFLPLTEKPFQKWTEYSKHQLAFRQHLNPLHLDLYYTKGVPCDTYLTCKKYNIR